MIGLSWNAVHARCSETKPATAATTYALPAIPRGGSGKSVPDYMNDDSFDIRNGCNAASSEAEFEKALRPGASKASTARRKIIENLRVFVAAARMRGERLTTSSPVRPSRTSEKPPRQESWPTNLRWELKITSGPVLDKPATWPNFNLAAAQRRAVYRRNTTALSPLVEEYPTQRWRTTAST